MSKDIRITKRLVWEIELKILTGIHIGGSKEIYGIGGIDNPVIKNPLNNQPIIPGSSLKGKIRSLLELNNDPNMKIFEPDENAPSRVIFRDMNLTNESIETLENSLGKNVFTEAKTENSIDKKTGKAANPRISERVPAGISFESEIVINAYDNEDITGMAKSLKKGFDLLELNYLGGSGTRGYGKVAVVIKNEREL
ncbi:MAG: type III-A CRISPR-associated RAMP protein Csm3 [Bacilli bacterium]|jgi:CRISPR-associated protein Csm3